MVSGILVGSMVGMLPGISPALVLIAITPLISHFDLVTLFIFYSCLISSSQYFGSVSAVVYGVAGEISSAPAAENGHILFRQGKGAYALLVQRGALDAVEYYKEVNGDKRALMLSYELDWLKEKFNSIS